MKSMKRRFFLARIFDARPRSNRARRLLLAGALLLGMYYVTYPENLWTLGVSVAITGCYAGIRAIRRWFIYRGLAKPPTPVEPWDVVMMSSGPRR